MTMGVLVVVAATGVLLDDRYLAGAPVWLKPLKFGISFLVYAISLGWVLARLNGRLTTRAGTALAGCSFVELMLITAQAARARESHFTLRQEPLDQWIARGMIAMIAVMWVASVIIAVVALRRRFGDEALTSAVRLGLVLTVTGAALGFLMTVPTDAQQAALLDGTATVLGRHSVGVPHGGPGLPVTGWSTDGGDLRIAHFVGIHALQALPLLAAVLGRFALPEPTRARLVRVGAAGYAGLVAITLVQALRAQPLLAPDEWTLLAVTLLMAGLAAGVARALRVPVTV